MPTISFKPKKVTKRIISQLHDRSSDVIMNRFGLTADGNRKTLEEIGNKYNITRERVRQIEASAIEAVRASKSFKDSEKAFDELCAYVESLGAIIPEEHLLSDLAADEKSKNRFRFLLVVGSSFFRERETAARALANG